MEAMKFRVESTEHSRQIQERLFEMGYKWFNGKKTRQLERKYLYTDLDGVITWSNSDLQPQKETTLKDILPCQDIITPIDIQFQPKQGEIIEVSDDGIYWKEREFVSKVDKLQAPILVFAKGSYSVITFKHARPINTIQIEIDKLQEQIDELKKTL